LKQSWASQRNSTTRSPDRAWEGKKSMCTLVVAGSDRKENLTRRHGKTMYQGRLTRLRKLSVAQDGVMCRKTTPVRVVRFVNNTLPQQNCGGRGQGVHKPRSPLARTSGWRRGEPEMGTGEREKAALLGMKATEQLTLRKIGRGN